MQKTASVALLPRPCLITSREVHEASLPRTCSRPCAFEVKKTKREDTKSHQTLKKHTMKYIHSSPSTATTSRRRATKQVQRVSSYSLASIDLGFVEIGLACIPTYVCTRTAAAAAAAPPVCALVLYTISGQRSFVFLCCDTRIISGFGVVLWCLTLSFP